MEFTKNSNRIHPLVAAAAVSVILVSMIGVAAMTGMLPNSHSTASPAAKAIPSSMSLLADTPAEPVSTKTKTAANNAATEKPAAPTVKHPKPVKHASTPSYSQRPTQVAQAPSICYSCGRVESVQPVQSQAKPSGLGVVAGGVVGGLLGNQVGGGSGRALATVAGAVGGGFAGNEIEKRTRTATSYQVRVRMEDGNVRTFPYNSQPNWQVGDRIKVIDGYLTARG